MKKSVFFSVFFSLFLAGVSAQNKLYIPEENVRLVPDSIGTFEQVTGYHLYVKKTEGISSILLTETTKDPSGNQANYAYRALEYNSINGDEKRILDGKTLTSDMARYSLVDSTPEEDEEMGQVFHIYIPRRIQYGYSWSRNGILNIDRGTFLNIRAFSKPYADYSGAFYDNSFMFDLAQRMIIQKENEEVVAEDIGENKEELTLTDAYNPEAAEEFAKFADFVIYSKGPETIVGDIMDSMKDLDTSLPADIVFAIDATGSMKDDIEQLRKEWIPELMKGLENFTSVRVGLLLYRDYGDNFKYRGLPVRFYDFAADYKTFEKYLNSFVIKGKEGGDIPEAVYEALYASMEFYKWGSESQKKIILIGDAEPHPEPRGTKKYSKELILKKAAEGGFAISAIITPDDKIRRGRSEEEAK